MLQFSVPPGYRRRERPASKKRAREMFVPMSLCFGVQF